MAKRKARDLKAEALRQRGCLNPHPEKVADPLFAESDFFDSRDLVQVKYEMVRRVKAEGHTVSASAAAFGFHARRFIRRKACWNLGAWRRWRRRSPGRGARTNWMRM